MTQVADPVAAFYDRHPYPPPVSDLERHRDRWRDRHRRRADHHLLSPAVPPRDRTEAILVAGCGTSQAARYAVRPGVHVTGIDVSPASLAQTRRLRDRHRLTNLELHELPVERATELGQRFDRVVCTGVLHHLADPAAGLRALREVLAPAGALHLMVYAPFGRTGIYLLQDYCRRLGVADTGPEIRSLVAALAWLPPHHPLTPLLRGSPDFGDPHAVADALLHPQDRAYSVPQLFALLAAGGMRFGRWYRQAPYLPQCGTLARTPHAARLAALPEVDGYAAAELFRGTMTRHSLLAYRDDSTVLPPGPDRPPAPSAVPVRLPDTHCLRERLPPGAAAVLLNASHTDRDLVLPIGPAEHRVFRAIDGRRSIGALARHCRLPPPQVTAFLLRLWRYDQVVFDRSGPA